MLIYAGDRSDDYYDKGYILLEGWHCSCYDWPEVDWDATHYEEDELLKIADMRKRNPSDSAERRFFMLDWHNPAVYPIDEPITMADLNANTAIGYDMVGTLKVGGDAPSVCL